MQQQQQQQEKEEEEEVSAKCLSGQRERVI